MTAEGSQTNQEDETQYFRRINVVYTETNDQTHRQDIHGIVTVFHRSQSALKSSPGQPGLRVLIRSDATQQADGKRPRRRAHPLYLQIKLIVRIFMV